VKILLTSGIFPPDIGGPATYVPELSRDLEALGHQVTIITLGERSETNFIGKTKVLKIGRDRSLVTRMVLTSFNLFKESIKSDAIFANGLFIETSLALSLARKRSRSVVKIVGDPVWERARNRGKTSLQFEEFLTSKLNFQDRFLRKIYNLAWSRFGCRMAPSQELCNFIRSQLPSGEVRFIPNGVDIPIESNVERDVDIICVSRLVNWKNVDLAIRVAKDLNLSILVIGDGPERQSLKALAGELEVKVNFQSQLSSDKVFEWLERSRYFFLLSDYEGLSFALLEAMVRGVVPVVSANAGNLSVIDSSEYGVITKIDKDAIVTAIAHLELNPKIALDIAVAAKKHVQLKFNGEVQRRQVIYSLLVTK